MFDHTLPPSAAAAAPAPASASPLGGGLGGGLFGKAASPAPSPFGGGLGGGLGGGSSLFGGAGAALGAAAPPADARSALFWRAAAELTGFSSRHVALATESHRQKSDVVILRHEGTTPADAHGGGARLPPRYSVLSSGAEWVVAETEHNAFESVALLLFHVAKHGGFLGSVDLKREIYSSWTAALSTDGAAPPPEPRSAVAYHAPLAILHPWSEGLDALPLAEVTASLNK